MEGFLTLNRAARLNQPAFTLVEMLVVIAIIAALLGILLPAISHAMGMARGFRCQMGMRSVAFDFQVFADPKLHGDRGDDTDTRDFRLETFQESQYGVDEFWQWGSLNAVETPDGQGNDPMRCPSVRAPLVLRRNLACSNGAIGPPEAVSYGFNLRLERAEVIDERGRPRAVPVRLRPDIVENSTVPLMMDVDGLRAQQVGSRPVYVAPSLGSRGPFANNRYWYPALRHGGRANAAFVDGHVDSSEKPGEEDTWRWGFQPIP